MRRGRGVRWLVCFVCFGLQKSQAVAPNLCLANARNTTCYGATQPTNECFVWSQEHPSTLAKEGLTKLCDFSRLNATTQHGVNGFAECDDRDATRCSQQVECTCAQRFCCHHQPHTVRPRPSTRLCTCRQTVLYLLMVACEVVVGVGVGVD